MRVIPVWVSVMQESDETKSVIVRVEGRVQGVWYRGWTVTEASRRGLRGWVRNRSDGSVEALFAGAKAEVDDMIEACWHGPPAAKVTGVFPKPADSVIAEAFTALPTV